MIEATAAPAHERSARTSLDWLANCNGTNSVLPGEEKETDVSQSSPALSAEGRGIDTITCPVDKDGTLRFWGSGDVRWSKCIIDFAHIKAQPPIARVTANKMEAPVTVIPDLATLCAGAPRSTASQWLFLGLSLPGEKADLLSDINVPSREADVASGPLPSKSCRYGNPGPPPRPAQPPLRDPRGPLGVGWFPMHGGRGRNPFKYQRQADMTMF